MKTVIVEARPTDATGAPVDVRLAGGGRSHYLFKGLADWRAGVVSPPRIQSALGFDKDGFTGGAIAQGSAVGFAPAMASTRALIAGLVWADAPITVSVGDDGAGEPVWTPMLVGTVAGYSYGNGRFVFTLSDMAGRLGEPLAKDSFAGTGGIEGDAAAKGRIKRRSWGRCWNVEGRLLLAAWNIYEFGDPARPLAAFDVVKEKGRGVVRVEVAWAGSIAATLDALKAASVPDGGCVVAPSIACVKFWTQPSTLTADLRGEIGDGYVETVPEIAARIAAAAEGPAIAGLADAIAIRPHPAGLHVSEAGETPAKMLDRLTLRASLAWSVGGDRLIRLRPIAFADPVETVRFEDVERRASYAPIANVKVGWQKNHRVHSDAEISAAVLASDLVYADGTTGEALKPAEPGATAGAPAGTTIGGVRQPDGSYVGGKLAKQVLTDILTNAGNTADLAGNIGAYKLLIDGLARAPDGSSLVEMVEQIGIKTEQNDLFIKNLQRLDPATGTALAMWSVGANGVVSAISQLAGPAGSVVGIYSDVFVLWDRNGGGQPIEVFRYGDGKLRMYDVEVDTLKAKSIDTPALADYAIRRGYTAELASNVALPANDGGRVR
ncbi:hypothetical protein [Sphingomonas sp. SORGH_AS_0879]|uniref:hypothetical protein n=1 Tax=Sphingomonas sp. SORGH_AS_0879 TaxID=3041790 RepID=UPI00277F3FEA|nr:hypothetical protein [Sphingomonas sp. SORGH_AS_0879]MDQ1229269.1 hypothetical protein [Sphingomonas sp. SORGH_AS_0879]